MKKVVIEVERPIFDQHKLQEFLDACEELNNKIDEVTYALNIKYNKRVKFNLELIIERAVDQFYESYTPNTYVRQEGLYTAKKITVNDDEWNFDTGAEYMKTDYEAGKEYVYVNSFEKGYHGGSIGGPDHPEPGVPWWKLHGEWYKPATRGPAPDQLIGEEGQNYIDEQEQEYENEWNRIIRPYFNKVMIAAKNLI